MLKPDLTMWHSGLYLDRPLVAKAIEAAGQDPRRMGQALALIRSEARRSMRYVKRPTTNAPPGQPPRARLPQRPNLRSIEYFWSPAIGMGVVGSAIFPGTRARLQYVPEVHEFGGPIRLPQEISIYKRPRGLKGSGRKATRKQLRALRKKRDERAAERRLMHDIARMRGLTRTVWRTYTYPPRPYMWPATKRVLSRLPRIWRGSLQFGNVLERIGPQPQSAAIGGASKVGAGFRVLSRAA